ncbi:MAG: CBS domain-containing protein [Deltaproteobacteria bacterium]|jgi:tRNA nucleotidyltransferase (CCA-adding enzyme)|nr:CBS domain-containing protein [Deltaproteobacteria bacterium]
MSELLRPVSAITSHINADYDALASMVAASRLYPEAVLLHPGAPDKIPGQALAEELLRRFPFVSPRECDLSQIRLLVVVDTHQAHRLAHLGELLDKPGLVIHVYDHHPDSERDLSARKKTIRLWGATSSILAQLIRKKKIVLSRDEATLLGLGIYEDTGAFTFPSTTGQDLAAAAFLRDAGMDLEVIAACVRTDLNRDQIRILHTLLGNAETRLIQGIPVTVTEIVLDDFIGDFAALVQKLMEMENLKVLFVIASMGSGAHLIARSRIPEIDAGQICSSFGGGGHGFAASASIKDSPPAEIRAELLTLLVSSVTPQMLVGRHMTSPAVTIAEDAPIRQAEEVMNRFGLKALPILDPATGACVGILEQHTAARANTHKLGDQPVREYMQRGIRALSPDSALAEAMEIILRLRQRLVPVLENGLVAGVLTRTDILRLLVDDSLHIPEALPLTRGHRERNVAGLVRAHLPREIVALLENAGRLGDALGLAVFAVGGFVRDLLLRRSNLDIDLSVEGDGIRFAHALAETLGGRVRSHHKFKTAIVFYTNAEGARCRLDVATARLEYYEFPAALPSVELASIKMDLYRRDFTINALAIHLNEKRFGVLIDPFNGQRDIKEKTLNVIHSLSFIEDPTRILRAVRFELRFHFRISAQAERLIKNALSLNMIDRLSGARLFNEFSHVLAEREAPSCLRRMENWKLLQMIHPLLKLTPAKDILLSDLDEVLAWYRLLYKTPQPRYWIIYLLALCAEAKYLEVAAVLERFGITDRARAGFLALREAAHAALARLSSFREGARPALSTLYDILHNLDVEGLIYLMARNGQEQSVSRDISLFLTSLRDIRTDISGSDLEALHFRPGPDFGEVLKVVLHAKIDRLVSTYDEQLSLAAKLLLKLREEPSSQREVLLGRT